MATEIVGRDGELGVITRVLERVDVASAACVIEGEPGVGKTTLWSAGLDAAAARGYRVIRARPARAETAFSFAVLGDLLRSELDEIFPPLPPPQRRALETALLMGEVSDPPANPHAVAVAALSGFTDGLRESEPSAAGSAGTYRL